MSTSKKWVKTLVNVSVACLSQTANKIYAATPATSPSPGTSVTIDIAAILSAVLWPLILLTVLLAYRQKIPALAQGITSRITKVGFAGVSLELAKASAFVPEWSPSVGALDLRHKATALQITDSTAMTFLAQLKQGGTADYAEINLGAGQEWLTSRLFIMAIVFARAKGVRCLVFVETSGNVRRRFVGSAEPEKIRWALAKECAWLEQAYASAYSAVLNTQQAFVVDHLGKLGNQFFTDDPKPSLDLVREFLQQVQSPPGIMLPGASDWIVIDDSGTTREHASWLTSEALERMLGEDLNRSCVRSSELRPKNGTDHLRMFLAAPGQFQAVVEDDRRFEYLLDRQVLLEQVSRSET
jgi:hypothetical protein